jgi:phosphoribosylformylglycinamidine synthase
VTKDELGGSVYYKTKGLLGAHVPRVDKELGLAVLTGVHRAIQARAVLAAHDLSEGGLAVAAAEMALGGRLGVELDLDLVVQSGGLRPEQLLFSESQSRILLEVQDDRLADLQANLHTAPHAVIGRFTGGDQILFRSAGKPVVATTLAQCERAWKRPLDLDGTLVAEDRQ